MFNKIKFLFKIMTILCFTFLLISCGEKTTIPLNNEANITIKSDEEKDGVQMFFDFWETPIYSGIKIIETNLNEEEKIIDVTQDMISGVNTKRLIFDQPINAFITYRQKIYQFKYIIISEVQTNQYTLQLNANQTVTIKEDKTIKKGQEIYQIPEKIEEAKYPVNDWFVSEVDFSHFENDSIQTIHLSKNIEKANFNGFSNIKNIEQFNADSILEYDENGYLIDKNNQILMVRTFNERLVLPKEIKSFSSFAFIHISLQIVEINIHEEMDYMVFPYEIFLNTKEITLSKSANLEIKNKYFIENKALYYLDTSKKVQDILLIALPQKQDFMNLFKVLEGTTIINEQAFSNISYIDKVIFPVSLKKIEKNAFIDSTFKEIEFTAKTIPIVPKDMNVFLNSHIDKIYVPSGCAQTYEEIAYGIEVKSKEE